MQYETSIKKILDLKAQIGSLERVQETNTQLQMQIDELNTAAKDYASIESSLQSTQQQLSEEVVPWALNKKTADIQAQVAACVLCQDCCAGVARCCADKRTRDRWWSCRWSSCS